MIIIQNTLSVCIISKNEEKSIERCVKSILGVADEVVLVDTGSTDNTIAIAKSLGVKVIEHIWNNNFSEARNISIENATKDWILFLDCDEEMSPVEAEKLKTVINDENNNELFEALYLRLVNIIGGVRISDAIVLRAFKNKPEYRFRGKMHEQIVNSIQEAKGLDCVASTPIEILHYGYDPEFSDTNKKSKRNLDILLSYDEKDKDGYYYYVLGNEYARVEDFDEALRIYEQSLKRTNALEFRYIYYPYLAMNMIKIYYVRNRFKDCIKLIDEFKKTLADFRDMYFMECLAYIGMSKLTKANEALTNYLNCKIGSYEYPSSNYENFHDIPKLIDDLNKGLVPHGDKMLSVWIPMDAWDDNITECIKSVNEIACEVFVITTSPKRLDIDKINQVGGKVLTLSPKNQNELYKIASNFTTGDYVLLMYPNELCSHTTQIQLSNLLNNDDDVEDAFILRILEMGTEKFDLRFSLFKTNKKVKSLEEYNSVLSKKGQTPYDIEILIHSKPVN